LLSPQCRSQILEGAGKPNKQKKAPARWFLPLGHCAANSVINTLKFDHSVQAKLYHGFDQKMLKLRLVAGLNPVLCAAAHSSDGKYLEDKDHVPEA
jgi:hypothetical protein